MARRAWLGFLVLLLTSLAGCFFLLPTYPEVLYEEDFGSESNWYVGSSENRNWWIEGGKYHVLIYKADSSYGTQQSNTGPLGNFQLDIDLQQLGGPNDNGYGIQFRMKDAANYYRFWISGDGYAKFSKTVDGTATNIIPWETTTLVHQGIADNHISIRANGSAFTFYINGTEWKSAVDPAFTSGHVGVMAIRLDAGGQTHITFDNLIITALE